MSGETVNFEKAVGDEKKREQSSILFPYLDLDAAVDVAKAIYRRAGHGTCDLDELAAEMGQTLSGAFRLKTGTARTFDLTEKDTRSGIKLSDLGRQVVNADTERAARVEAFLRVPLYGAIFEKYKGHLLPPMKALEREMSGLGVSAKQTDKARQAFERSARQAGYFEAGEDRLVRPRVDPPTRRAEPAHASDDDRGDGRRSLRDQTGDEKRGGSGGGGDDLHPFIKGLLETLPAPNTDWSAAERADWLQTAASIFKLIYKGTGSIEVRLSGERGDGQ
jgi:hypothetical protein